MVGVTKLIKSFFNDKGIDIRSSDLVRKPEFASGLLNADYRKTGALNKRKGFHSKEEDFGGIGLAVYQNIDSITGIVTEELLSVGNYLYKLEEENITITYVGSGVSRFNMILDNDTQKFKAVINEDGSDVLDFDLGVGINEASVITLANLKTQIDALSDYSAVISGRTSVPAAFIEISRDITLDNSGVVINYVAFSTINSPLVNPLATTISNKNNNDFQNASTVNLNNILYLATGYDEMYKYDGQNFYRSGMPRGTTPTTADGGAGNITNTNIVHIITHVQKDNKGNIIEGIESGLSTGLNLDTQSVDVTATNIEDDTGFNTNCGIVVGNQGPLNILTLDDGSGGNHTLKIGDTAYFYDSVEADYIEREITAIATTTITVAGAAVTVVDNAVISNNLRIAIFRNKAAGTTYYLVAEIPNDSFSTTQVYNDDIADGSLGAAYVPPVKQHGLPPKSRYLTVFQNTLVALGGFIDPSLFSWSEPTEPEYFPAGDNQQLVETSRGDKITGGAVNNNALFILKSKSIHTLQGNISETDKYQVDELAGGDVGCVSHHTIAEIQGTLYFLSLKGVYKLTLGDNEPSEVSFPIEPIFDDIDATYNFNKAVAINWFQKDKYVLMLPAELSSGGNLYTDSNNSTTIVYDYSRKSWLQWDALDFQAGIVLYDNKLYMSERRLGTVTSNVESNLYVIQDTGDTYDYADHNQAISYEYKTHWEALQDPDIFKKFLRLKVQSLDASVNDFESDTFVIDIETQLNYNDAPNSSFSMDFSPESGWGEFLWGIDEWGSVRILKLKSKLKSAKAQSIRVIFRNNTIHENILISGWTLEAVFPYKTRIKE